MNRNPRQPDRKLRLPLILIEMLVGANVGILHHVFCLSIITQNGPRQSIKPLIVAAHDDLVEGSIPSPDPLDHFLVGPSFRHPGFKTSYGAHSSLWIESQRGERLQA